MKRFLCVFLSSAITLCLLLSPASAAKENPTFTDVPPDAWFAPYVEVCAEKGLLNGVGEGKFNPDGVLNGDEALVMAARVLLMANGETEFPKGPDAQAFWDWAGWNRGQYFPFGSSVAETQSYVDAWCWDALFYLAQAAGPELFPADGLTYACTRATFFKALAFAAQGLTLEEINDISFVPGTREEGILRLYRAGILSGSDGYGSFDGSRELTRAEAAAALARIAEPSLRVSFTPQEYPYQGYTLTPLMDIEATMGLTYPVAAILYREQDYQQISGLLTMEGKLVDYPEGGHIYSSGVSRSYDYAQFYVVDDDWNAKTWLMDKDGNYAPGSGEYQSLSATGDGHFLASNDWSDGELGHTSWYLLSPDGTVEAELPETLEIEHNRWHRFNEGVCPWMDEETGLWGYVDARGSWVMEPAWALAQAFEGGYAILYNDQDQCAVIDRSGNFVIPFQDKQLELPRSSPDCEEKGLIRWEYWEDDWEINRAGYLSLDGTVYEPDAGASRFYNGFATAWDEGGQYYLDANLQRRTEPFDRCGDLTSDGQGFVALDGKFYRIQFDR